MELRRYAAYGFLGGVAGGASVVLFSLILFHSGISSRFGVDSPLNIGAPDIYRPLFWGGLWGIPFGMMMRKMGDGVYGLWLGVLPGAGGGTVPDIFAVARHGIFRTWKGRIVHTIPVACKPALRDCDRRRRQVDFGRKGPRYPVEQGGRMLLMQRGGSDRLHYFPGWRPSGGLAWTRAARALSESRRVPLPGPRSAAGRQ